MIDKATAVELVLVLLDGFPDEWFPRGKWATIQAIQQRAAGTGP